MFGVCPRLWDGGHFTPGRATLHSRHAVSLHDGTMSYCSEVKGPAPAQGSLLQIGPGATTRDSTDDLPTSSRICPFTACRHQAHERQFNAPPNTSWGQILGGRVQGGKNLSHIGELKFPITRSSSCQDLHGRQRPRQATSRGVRADRHDEMLRLRPSSASRQTPQDLHHNLR